MMVKMVPADMRRAAAAWDAAGEQVKSANPSDRVGEISTAMPGGASPRQVGQFVSTLGGQFDEWCAGATKMSETYRAVAADHHATDQDAASEGGRQVGAVSTLPGIWSGGSSAGKADNVGPAIFDPSAPSDDNIAKLIARLGKLDS
ncbi:hypothetical protein [Nocardioides panzhihuensis]|uniref:Uncharacterized protein n=1 Tax=Nocardioides panzhihuensis TaxID=860243 RepID=A0A7Z0IV91_9ACTN|nr:hypothetical protein [Nocardioides panzhihuensis]NYI80796.1 hypothetical protein [Nocardioides panzhihuensis]